MNLRERREKNRISCGACVNWRGDGARIVLWVIRRAMHLHRSITHHTAPHPMRRVQFLCCRFDPQFGVLLFDAGQVGKLLRFAYDGGQFSS